MLRLLLTLCLLAALTTHASAGPILRALFGGRCHAGHCQPQQAPAASTTCGYGCGSGCSQGACGTAGQCGAGGCVAATPGVSFPARPSTTSAGGCPGGTCPVR